MFHACGITFREGYSLAYTGQTECMSSISKSADIIPLIFGKRQVLIIVIVKLLNYKTCLALAVVNLHIGICCYKETVACFTNQIESHRPTYPLTNHTFMHKFLGTVVLFVCLDVCLYVCHYHSSVSDVCVAEWNLNHFLSLSLLL